MKCLEKVKTLRDALPYVLDVREIKCEHQHPGPDFSCAKCRADAALEATKP